MQTISGKRNHRSPVATVVIPVAGRGTRLFPATKVVPKVLVPVGRKPLLLYAIEEAVASGAERIVVVTNHQDSLIRSFPEADSDLERTLVASGRLQDVALLRAVAAAVPIVFVRQDEPRGLADSIRCARSETGDAAFGVILPDALITGEVPCLGQLIEFYLRHPGFVIATRHLHPDETEHYGILVTERYTGGPGESVLRVKSMVEKPKPEAAPSLYGVFGRYILEPTIFDSIDRIEPDSSGELQITDALNLCCSQHQVYGFEFTGEHFDCDEWLGYARATVDRFLADQDIGQELRAHLWTVLAGTEKVCCATRGLAIEHVQSLPVKLGEVEEREY